MKNNDYKKFDYKIKLSYEDLLNIKTTLSYSQKRLYKDDDIGLRDELISLHDRINKDMMRIIEKTRQKQWNL